LRSWIITTQYRRRDQTSKGSMGLTTLPTLARSSACFI
jgi:hypothetical protein